jgi:two-component system cell cycle response regulator
MMGILCERVERLTTCLANESLVDDLTHLNNKRGFCRALEQEMHRAERQREILTMALLEIDFVDAPDGHVNRATTNDMFHKIGVTLCKDIRRCDMVGRIDTNTFVVLIPSENDEGASVVMDRLRDNITAFQARFESTVGFSFAMSAVKLNWGENSDGGQALEDTLRKLKSGDGLLWSSATDSLN